MSFCALSIVCLISLSLLYLDSFIFFCSFYRWEALKDCLWSVPKSLASSSCQVRDFMQNFLFLQCRSLASQRRFASIVGLCLLLIIISSIGSVLSLGNSGRTLKFERVVQSITIREPYLSRCTALSQISLSSQICTSKPSLYTCGCWSAIGVKELKALLRLASSFWRMRRIEETPALTSAAVALEGAESEMPYIIILLQWGKGRQGGQCVCVGQIREIIIELMRENEEDEDRNFQMITAFIQAVKQERLSPGLLTFQRDLFEEIREMVRNQRNNLKDYLRQEHESETKVATKNFKYMIYNSQIEKVDYLLKTYLKTRLKKIQLFCFHLVKNESEADQLLSDQEKKFLNNYARLRYQYYKDNVFKLLVKNYRDFRGVEIIFAKSEEEQRERRAFVDTKQSQVELKSPNLNEHVFAEILTNPNQLRFGLDLHASNTNTEQMEVISPGSIVFGPFRNIAERFTPSQFRLI